MFDETSDILGGHTLPNVRGNGPDQWSSLSFTLKFAFILALVLVGYVASIRVWEHLLKWRERTYKLSMRRRHGIPDNDRRPFNVAFAAVVRARQDHEATDRSKHQAEQPGPSHDQLNALPEQSIRQRPGAQRNVEAAWPNGPVNGLPGRFNSVVVDTFGSTSSTNVRNYPSATPDPLNFSDRYNPNLPINQVVEHGSSPPRTGPSRRSSRKNLSIKGNDDDGRKRAFDEDDHVDEPDNVKKTKVEGDELIDGDEDPEWQERHQQPIKRGSKRVLGEEDDDEEAAKSKRKRDKRARKISIDRNPQAIDVDHIMGGERDVDAEDEDEVTELKSISRGKKRDRAEAGSTFGGDDEDSPLESEGEGDAQARRRRKRRTVSKRKSDVGTSSRGKKRDRDLEEEDSGGEAEDWATRRLSRKKRGKKVKGSGQGDDEEQKGCSDVSMDDSVVSKGQGRRVGDEWESNGVRYKVSPNGQRLRQALVKKARQKFTMPKDSQHPDRIANLEVCVETWLTEDEFKEAKAQHLLAWQDSPKPSVEPETPTADNQESPSSPAPVGKNLLWGSPASSSSAPSPTSSFPPQGTPTATPFATPQTQPKPKGTRDTYRHSIATNVGLRINPFQQPQAPPNRRVASTSRVASVFSGGVPSIASSTPGLADSTNSSPRGAYRMFSKWEKQELEAEAMRKMREANRKKEREREEKEREEKERKEKEKREKEKAAAAAAVPLISITKPAEDTPAQSENKPPPTFTPQPAAGVLKPPSFSVPKTSTSPKVSFATPTPTVSSSTSTQQKPQSEPAVPNSFGPPSGKSASSSNTFSFAKEPVAEPFPNTANTNTSSSVFGRTTRPVAGASAQKHANPAKPSGFTLPSSGGNAASGSAGGTPASAPSFSFAPPAQGGQSALAFGGEQKKAEGASLLSRVGGFGGTQEGSGPNSGSTQPQPQSQPQQGGSVFSFNKPAGEAPKPTSVFGVSNTPQSTPPSTGSNVTTAAPPATVGTSSGLKFNFGFSGKASSSTPAPAPGATSVNGAPSVDSSKPNLSSFGFAPAKSSASTTSTSAEPASGASAPKYNFGAPPSTSAFANHSGGQNSTPSTQPKDASAKSAFGGFGGGPLSNGTFSKTTPAASTSAFGSGTNTNVFGGSNSTFGASGSKSKEAPKPTFSFATPAAPSSSANGTNGEAPKSAFSFPNPSTTPSANPAAAPSPFSFKFGDSAPNNSTTPQASPLGAQPPPAQSAFGSNSGAGAFGFGTTPASGAFSGFGGASKSTGQ